MAAIIDERSRQPVPPASPARPAAFQFPNANRWTSTVTNGSGLKQGDPTTLTWSIVPDNTPVHGHFGEPASNSNLIAFLGNIYGVTTKNADLTDEPWFPLFESFLTRWGEVSGLTYVHEPNDDGSALSQFVLPSGLAGVRGDIRIAGHFIDGQSSPDTLAYNFFPNDGDMVIDTGNGLFFGNTTDRSLGLRNVLAHEHGHGLGIDHVCPVIATADGRLMEPFVNLDFDGPQFDDILAIQRGYGDALEKKGGNDTAATATNLGMLKAGQILERGTHANDNRVGPTEFDFISIDDDSDIDFFKFTVPDGLTFNVTVTPRGPTYQSGSQHPTTGDCSEVTSFDAAGQSDLTLTLLDTNGSTVLETANANGLGGSESLQNMLLPGGTYFVRVTGAQDAAQMYLISVAAADITPPRVMAFTLKSPAAVPTNSDTLVFSASFSEPVTGVDAADFSVSGTTGTIAVAQATPNTFELTVSGGDLVSLNGTVGLDFAGSPTISDLAGNIIVASEPPVDEMFQLDNVPPFVQAFARKTPAASHTNADTLVFVAIFSEAVTGVGPGDFAVANTTASIAILQVAPDTFDVTVSGGDLDNLNGTVELRLSGSATISDTANNGLAIDEPAIDETYRVDNLAPAVVSFTLKTPGTSPTNADNLVFAVSFTESVAGVDAGDFVVTGTTGTITVLPVSPISYDVTVSGGDLGSLDGIVELTLAHDATISDLAENAAVNSEPAIDEPYLVDNTAPVAMSFTRKAPGTSPTNADSLVFTATFSEGVIGVDAGDFAITGTTGSHSVIAVSMDTYEVTVSGGDLSSLNGTVTLSLAEHPLVHDEAGNDLTMTEPGIKQSYQVDNTPPVLASLKRKTPENSLTNADSLVFEATFGEAMLGVDASSFAAVGTTGTTTVLQVRPDTYDITVAGGDLGSLDGNVELELATSGTITDAAGNALASTEPGVRESYLIDNTPPAAVSFTRKQPMTSPTSADFLVFSVMFTEPVANVDASDFSVAGTTAEVTVNHIAARMYEVTVSGGDLANLTADVELNLAVSPAISDMAGNGLLPQEPKTDEFFLVDNRPPSAPVIQGFTADTGSSSLDGVTRDETLTITGDSEPLSIVQIFQDGTPIGLTVTDETGVWSLDHSATPFDDGIYAIHAQAIDLAGNSSVDSPVTTLVIDRTAPDVDILEILPDPTHIQVQSALIAFSEPVTGLDLFDFTLTRDGTQVNLVEASLTAVSAIGYAIHFGSATSLDGQYELTFVASGSDVVDVAGNGVRSDAAEAWTFESNLPPTEIELSGAGVLENALGAVIGVLSAADPNPDDAHVFLVEDDRFEVVAATLKLRDDESLSRAAGESISVLVTARDTGEPPREFVKTLELTVLANPFPWQNSDNRFDTTGDARVVPLDVLVLINQLNEPTVLEAGGRLPSARPANSPLPFFDVNGDGFGTPNDALQLINHLSASGEGELVGSGGMRAPSGLVTIGGESRLGDLGGQRLTPRECRGRFFLWTIPVPSGVLGGPGVLSNRRVTAEIHVWEQLGVESGPGEFEEILEEIAADRRAVRR